ncbi:MAG: fibronectin type III domain-containing protein, partial [Lutibacter sp.]|nr:fibronectin type III domain-containing protein [Lutibacter sp.]
MVNNVKNDRVRYWFYHESIGNVYIDEPIGFNDDSMEYTRHSDYHGVFTLFTNNLEFYGDSRQIIIDFFAIYGVNGRLKLGKDNLEQDTTQTNTMLWVNEYEGFLDFSTYSLSEFKATCKFSTSGVAELLKSRESTEVEIERTDTLDGKIISKIENNLVALTPKKVLIVNQSELLETDTFFNLEGYTNPLFTPLTKFVSNVHNDFSEVTTKDVVTVWSASSMFWVRNEAASTNVNVSVDIDGIHSGEFVGFSIYKFSWNGSIHVHENTYSLGSIINSGVKENLRSNVDITLALDESLALVLDVGNTYLTIQKLNITVTENSDYITTKTEYPFIFIDDLLRKLTEINVNKDIYKSNFYSTTGDGSLRGFISGLQIRNFVSGTKGYKSPKISFKDLISSCDAVDCIGLGLQKDTSGGYLSLKDQIRIEDKKYFYQDVVTITLPSVVSNLTRDVQTDGYFSELEFGYQNGGGYESEMGLDEPNLSTKLSTAINTIKNTYSKISKVSADGHGKEFTRRKPQDKFPTDDTKGDEYNWFLDIKDRLNINEPYTEKLWQDRFQEEPTGLYDPDSFTGLWFSPINNMLRHSWFFSQGFEKNLFDYTKFASSKGNSDLVTKLNSKYNSERGNYLNFDLDRPRFVPELVKFEYSVSESIKKQLKGYTEINGELVPNAYGLVEYVINDSGVKEQGYLNSVKPNGIGEWEVIKFNNITRRSNEKLKINNGVIGITSINVLEVTSVDTSIPVAPIMGVLYKTVNSGSDVQLAWTTATDINGNLDGYNIYYKKSIDVNWTLFGISATLGTTVTGLTKNTNYDFRITAYDSGTPVLESLPSNITSILTIETTPPVIWTLSSSTPTETTIPLYWTAATSDIDIFLYKLYYKKSSDPIFVSYINIGNTILTY